MEQVSLRELGNATVGLCAVSGGTSRDELFRETLAVFGVVRVTAGIAATLDAVLEAVVADGRLVLVGTSYRAG